VGETSFDSAGQSRLATNISYVKRSSRSGEVELFMGHLLVFMVFMGLCQVKSSQVKSSYLWGINGYQWVFMGLCQVKSSCQHSLMNSWSNSPVGRIVVHLALRLMSAKRTKLIVVHLALRLMYAKRTRTRILLMIQFGSLRDPAGFFELEC
jgi:hypothetical protein